MSQPQPVPRWVRTVTVVAVSVVAAVAAIASYDHMHELAVEAGEEWRAHLIPLSVDGMLVAASMVMLVRRKAGRPAGWLPWTGLLLGLGASLAANVAAADDTWLSRIVTGWPPVALAVSFELLILVTRDRDTATANGSPVARPTADPPAPAREPLVWAAAVVDDRAAVEPPAPQLEAPTPPAAAKPTPTRPAADGPTDDEVAAALDRAVAAGEGLPSRNRLMADNRPMGTGRADRLLAAAADRSGIGRDELDALGRSAADRARRTA